MYSFLSNSSLGVLVPIKKDIFTFQELIEECKGSLFMEWILTSLSYRYFVQFLLSHLKVEVNFIPL